MTASALVERLRRNREEVSPADPEVVSPAESEEEPTETPEEDEYTPTTPEDYDLDLEAEKEHVEAVSIDAQPYNQDTAAFEASIELVATRLDPAKDGRAHFIAYDKAERVTINIYAPASVVGPTDRLVVIAGS